MADVDGMTLMMAIQAVNEQIRRFELLLTSETLREAYTSESTSGGNLPEYSKLVSNG